jgi:hypothetical protein
MLGSAHLVPVINIGKYASVFLVLLLHDLTVVYMAAVFS